MSEVRFRCICGHIVTTAVGNSNIPVQRNQNIPFQIHALCPACHALRGNPPKDIYGLTSLRRLSGSLYQVTWAKDIRQKHMSRFRELVREHPSGIAYDMLESMITLVNERTSAGWWIDNVANTFRPLIPHCHRIIRPIVIHAAYQTNATESPRYKIRSNPRSSSKRGSA